VEEIRIATPLELKPLWKEVAYKGEPVKVAKDSEFAIARCEEFSKYYTLHFHKPRFNETVYKTAEKAMAPGKKPLMIVMPTLDSLSRRHFFRKLPETVEYLNKLADESEEFKVYDFKVHNIIGSDTAEN
jgi:hypothetical protein